MHKVKRKQNELRPIKMKRNFLKYADGSCLIEFGNTKVICSVSIEEGVPRFLKGQGTGWITSEYAMLPRSCRERIPRESSKGKVGGRTHEIQRLIGRSLRTVVDMDHLGERTLWVDCDVVQGDGGTRTASITGSFVALSDAINSLLKKKLINVNPIKECVGAVSVGIINGRPFLDLDYDQDSTADVDMNFVMTESKRFIEIQGTAEREPFSTKELDQMMVLAKTGIEKIIALQKKVLKIS